MVAQKEQRFPQRDHYFPHKLPCLSTPQGGLVDPQLRASNEHLPSVRVPRAGGRSGYPFLCYRMVASKLTLAFMELEIRQFASAFSINSLALAASAFTERVIVGFNVMVVN